jgi:hypothetical protein
VANGNGNGYATGDGFWRDMPWWVKAIAIVGVPSLISIGVIVSDRTQLAGTVTHNSERLQAIEQMHVTHDSRVLMRFEDLDAATKETNRILLATCLNDAAKIASAELAERARDRCVGR